MVTSEYSAQIERKGKGLGIAGMVLGIIGAINAPLPLINILAMPIAIVGLILSAVSIAQAKKTKGSLGFGIAGLVCSVFALVLTFIMYAGATAVS